METVEELTKKIEILKKNREEMLKNLCISNDKDLDPEFGSYSAIFVAEEKLKELKRK